MFRLKDAKPAQTQKAALKKSCQNKRIKVLEDPLRMNPLNTRGPESTEKLLQLAKIFSVSVYNSPNTKYNSQELQFIVFVAQ